MITLDNQRNVTYSKTIVMVTENCSNCGILFAMPQDYIEEMRRTEKTFCCPNGHKLHYSESEATKLKKQLQQKENELSNKVIQNIQLENQLNNVNKKLKKVAAGQCPCCGITFKHLAKHMANKHPNQ
jgi:hypothetical protein